jgi:hypothetical protein
MKSEAAVDAAVAARPALMLLIAAASVSASAPIRVNTEVQDRRVAALLRRGARVLKRVESRLSVRVENDRFVQERRGSNRRERPQDLRPVGSLPHELA